MGTEPLQFVTVDFVMRRVARVDIRLIELGELVAKAGLIELAGDDRAVILGVLVEAAARLRSDDREAALLLWRRRGKRTVEDDRDG